MPIKVIPRSDDAPEGFIGCAVSISASGDIFLSGGIDEDGNTVGDYGSYDLDMGEWENGGDDTERCYHSLTWINGCEQFLAWGGAKIEDNKITKALSEPRLCQDGVWFSAVLKGPNPEPRYGHTLTALD
eukprot:UN25011